MAENPTISDEKSKFGNNDEFSWEAYFFQTGALAVDVGAFSHVVCSQQRLVPSGSVDLPNETVSSSNAIADLIETGRFVDVQDERDPRRVWPAEILENAGGRLLLKYVCVQDAGSPFWEFCLSERVHPAGVCETDAGRELDLQYALPSTCKDFAFDLPQTVLEELTRTTKSFTLDAALFQSRSALEAHQFEVGMFLEAVDPSGGSLFYAAQVVQVLNKYYFLIEHDTSMLGALAAKSDAPLRACHARSPGLFPIGFAAQRGLSFAAPESFDWAVYLRTKGGRVANEKCFPKTELDDRFRAGRRLEAVNPSAPHQICAATIIRCIENLLWLHFDSATHLTHVYVIDRRSTKLFPCGWCQSNGYPLKAPYEHNLKDFNTAQANLRSEVCKYEDNRTSSSTPISLSNAQEIAFMPSFLLPGPTCPWSPAIYVTHCCTGPHVCRYRLDRKPRQIGPGPMIDVLKEVAENLISSSFRPRELLAELQSDDERKNLSMQSVEIKAKYKTKRWRGQIDFCVDPRQIPEWCRQLCVRSEACPGLLCFKPYLHDKCPFDCQRTTKTRCLGVIKPLSDVAAKRLKNRLAVHQKRSEAAAGDNGTKKDEEKLENNIVLRKRSRRQMSSTTITSEMATNEKGIINRPITRGAKLNTERNGIGRNQNSGPPRLTSANGDRSEEDQNSKNGMEYSLESNTSESSTISISNGVTVNGGGRLNNCFGYSFDNGSTPASMNQEYNWCRGENEFTALQNMKKSKNEKAAMAAAIRVTIPAVETNPLFWTPNQLHQWLRQTVISGGVADQLKEELVDGQAFMLMDIRDVQEYLGLKLGPALKVCGVVKELKLLYLKRYTNFSQETKECKKCSARPNRKCTCSCSTSLLAETAVVGLDD